MSENITAVTRGAHHVGLTVPNLEQSRRFFTATLGYEQVGEVPDYPAAFLTLHQPRRQECLRGAEI